MVVKGDFSISDSSDPWAVLEKAIKISIYFHEGQRRWSGEPYIMHVLRVAGALTTAEEKTVAFLHDIIEDTKVTLEDLHLVNFPRHIVNAVNAITHRTTVENYKEYIDRLSKNSLARVVKLADLKDNINILTDPKFTDPSKKEGNFKRIAQYWDAHKFLDLI